MRLGRDHVIGVLAAALLAAGALWFAQHTEWVDVQVPDELKGAGRRDVNDHLKQLAIRLGARVTTAENLAHLPPAGATLLLSSWYWDLFPERKQALQRWVEQGGHLVLPFQSNAGDKLGWVPVDWRPLARGKPAAPAASSPAQTSTEDDEGDDDHPVAQRPALPAAPLQAPARCAGAVEEPADVTPAFGVRRSYAACFYPLSVLHPRVQAQWALLAPEGLVVVRVPLGAGSVTVTSVMLPWQNRQLLESENAVLAAATLRLRPGQQLWFVAEETRPALPVFLWRTGAPAIALGALALAFALWRGAVRFGPRAAVAPTARRSVAEQIRGTAAFVSHHGGKALLAAELRALDDAARPRLHGYRTMTHEQRAQAIAALTTLDAPALAQTMRLDIQSGTRHHAPAALTLLETARRRLLSATAPAATPIRNEPTDKETP